MTRYPSFVFDRRGFLGLAAGAAAASPFAAFAQSADEARLKIATIGSGRQGGALGTLFARQGYPVMFSSRHPDELKGLAANAGSTAKAGAIDEAVTFGDVVLLVVPYTAVDEMALAAKPLVIDVSNPIARRDGEAIVNWVAEQGGAGLATAKLLPGAHLVRAFNAINFLKLTEGAHRAGEPIGVPIAGDDPAAIALASRLIREIGFELVAVGGLAMGKYLVPATPLAGVHTAAEIRRIAATLE